MHFLLSAVLAFGQASPASNPYLKTTTEANGVFSLQTGAHRLTAPGKPVVWLIGAAHIGTKHYYASLQKLLDFQGEVLFEGVKQGASAGPAAKPAQNPASQSSAKPSKPIYQVLSDALGLDFQLVDINYAHPNWIDSDLTMDELQALNKAASNGKPTEFDTITKLLDPASPMAALFSGMITQMTPGTLEGLKLFFVKQLSTIDPGAILSDPATGEVVLTARNRSVETYFAKALAAPTPPASVAIFYGALHQQDIESALAKQYGYTLSETRWFTAATADTHKVDAQGQAIYNLLLSQFSGKPGVTK